MKTTSDLESKPVPYADIFTKLIKQGFKYKDMVELDPKGYYIEYPLRGMILPEKYKSLGKAEAAIFQYKNYIKKLLTIKKPE